MVERVTGRWPLSSPCRRRRWPEGQALQGPSVPGYNRHQRTDGLQFKTSRSRRSLLPGRSVTHSKFNRADLFMFIILSGVFYFYFFYQIPFIKYSLSMRIGKARNLFIFALSVIINYLIFVIWYPIAEINRTMIFKLINIIQTSGLQLDIKTLSLVLQEVLQLAWETIAWRTIQEVFASFNPLYSLSRASFLSSFSDDPGMLPLRYLLLSPNVFRFVLSVVFVGSF
jgi:hypothetical protein